MTFHTDGNSAGLPPGRKEEEKRMNREEAAGILSVMRDTLKKVYLVAIDEERISALESAIGYLLAEDNNVPVKQPDIMISLEWVKTTDRLPIKEDAGIDDLIAFCYRDEWDCFNRLEKWDEISPQKHTYWHRMLKAPEVEE
jgi:hypothetical protein